MKMATTLNAIYNVIQYLLFIAINRAVNLEIPEASINFTDKQLLDHLLNHRRYDARVRPAARTVVNVSVLLLTLSSPDESSVTYEVGFLIHLLWSDPRVEFEDIGKYKYLNALMHADMLWMPDFYFIKHGEFKYPIDHLDPVHISLKIFPNGTVLYTTRRHMVLTCEGNLKIFPFDSPKCFFAIESVSLEREQLDLQWNEDSIRASESLKTMNAYMMLNKTNVCNKRHTWRREYSCLSVLLVFSRDKSFYFSTVFMPGIVLVTSSFISFWLDVNAVPARVMIGVTTMLNFCTTTNSFRSKLPIVSNLTAMNLWDFVCMFFIYASMIEFIIVNYLHRKIPHSSRLASDDRRSFSQHDYLNCFRSNTNGKKMAEAANIQKDRIAINKTKEDLELKAPLVGGDDPQVINHKPKRERNRSLSDIHHIQHSTLKADESYDHHMSQQPSHTSARVSSLHEHDRVRAAASVFAWLRRPQIFRSNELTSRARLARSIDHISKTVFTLLFTLFSFFFFLTYAVIKPSQLDDWIEKEFDSQ